MINKENSMRGKLIYFDAFAYDEAKRNASNVIKKMNECALILSNYKYSVSVETLKECIAVRFKEISVKQIDPNFIGDRSQVGHVGDSRIVRLVDGAPLLAEECRSKVEKVKQMANSIEEEESAVTNINAQFEDMIWKVINCRERGSLIRAEVFRLVAEHLTFDSDSFKAGVNDSFDEALKELCNVYCMSKKAEKAMALHEQAAAVLGEFMDMVKDEYIPEDMSGLFAYVDSKVEITQIDYNKFLK